MAAMMIRALTINDWMSEGKKICEDQRTLIFGADRRARWIDFEITIKATEGDEKGTYKARIVLEMYGDWALRLDLSGAVRDRVIKVLRFQSDHVGEATPAPSPGTHRH